MILSNMTRIRVSGFGLSALVLGFALVTTPMTAVAADDDAEMVLKARAVSTMNIARAASDLLDIKIFRWSTPDERQALAKTLETQGNKALAAQLAEQEDAGWVSFDPRGGGGPGRDPRRTTLRYARQIINDDKMEVILVTNHYIGYGTDPQAADGAKLAEYPLSVVILDFEKDDRGEWIGDGRMIVGTKIRFDTERGRFRVDAFPMDPVFLRQVKVK